MKKYLFLTLVTSVCLLSSCRQDEDFCNSDVVTDSLSNGDYSWREPCTYVPSSRKLSKFSLRKVDSVYFIDMETLSFGAEKNKYRTLKLMKPGTNIGQEWFLEDLHETFFLKYPDKKYLCRKNDYPDGRKHGIYYMWRDVQEIHDHQDQVDFVFGNKNGVLKTGFHVPTEADIENLIDILGGSDKIPNTLRMEYDAMYLDEYQIEMDTTSTNMWIYYPELSSRTTYDSVIFLNWYIYSDTKKVSYYHHSNHEVGVNIRLVRNITPKEW